MVWNFGWSRPIENGLKFWVDRFQMDWNWRVADFKLIESLGAVDLLFFLCQNESAEKRTRREEILKIKRFFFLFFKIFKNRPEFQRKSWKFSIRSNVFFFCSFSKFLKIALNFKEKLQSNQTFFFSFSTFSKIALNFKEKFEHFQSNQNVFFCSFSKFSKMLYISKKISNQNFWEFSIFSGPHPIENVHFFSFQNFQKMP